ncbi:MAG: protein-L-isoaspartate(D-aspartate) O-methyltransferase [Halobacteriales archaeon]|nr:protein-L-isoaspartate(D-aspartate) O-methyltransferase [Halobacteriales archaeon]
MDAERQRERLVSTLQAEGVLRSVRVARALRAVPRHLFVAEPGLGYIDRPVGIGQGQTISAPHMVAIMGEALDLRPGQRVLEVGAGSGYHAAVAAELVRPGGQVLSIERFPELADRARANLRRAGVHEVEVVEGDGGEGWPEGAPYDRVYLTCAAPDIPQPLLDQLAPDGILLAPLGPREEQVLTRVRRGPQGWVREELGGCVFVPLVGRFGFSA